MDLSSGVGVGIGGTGGIGVGAGFVLSPARLPCILRLIVFASFTNLSVASVASNAFTMRVLNFLSCSNSDCRALVALMKIVLALTTPEMLPCAFASSVFNVSIWIATLEGW